MLPLLRLFGRGTWKWRPNRSVRSSSSLELEFSSVLIPLERVCIPILSEIIVRGDILSTYYRYIHTHDGVASELVAVFLNALAKFRPLTYFLKFFLN